ncbi:MAG: HAMP domain-containing protein, partial [Acidobacteria bacterium]|nr:HAMP domain-containing protein [Acidobacteriota bacterium]
MKVRTPRWRVRILHILLLILIGVSAVPLWFYGQKMISMNQETLQLEQNILQTNISRSLAKLIAVHMENLREQLKEFFDDVVPLAARIPQDEYASSQALRERLENFALNNPDFLYLTLLNTEARGLQAGGYDAAQDLFLRKELESAFFAARQGEEFTGDPQTISRNQVSEPEPGMVLAQPIWVEERFLGMVGAVVSLGAVVEQLKETQRNAGLEAYVVNKSGRLVAHSDPAQAVGRDLSEIPIVQRFLAAPPQAIVTSAFELGEGEDLEGMLGTHAPIGAMAWGVIVQKKLSEAYSAVAEMRSETLSVGFAVVFLILIVGFLSAKAITSPIDNLARTARSIAQRDFTQRADVRDRTEIGELAETFNLMAGDIQHYIADLEDASNKNRQLFLESLSMIAAAV